MSKAKDIARAEVGHPHPRNTSGPRMVRQIVCANCHNSGGNYVKVGDYYFHRDCPKKMVPFPVVVATAT